MPSFPQTEGCFDLTAEYQQELEALMRLEPEHQPAALTKSPKLYFGFMLGFFFLKTASESAGKGYEKYFKNLGWGELTAKGVAAIARRSGLRQAAESRRRPAIFAAIKYLAQENRRRSAFLQRAQIVLLANDETSIIGEMFERFSKANPNSFVRNEFEFIDLLKAAAAGDFSQQKRISEIARLVASQLPSGRGRPVSAASASHAFLLEIADPDIAEKYTYDPYKGTYKGKFVEATRREFDDPSFNPKAAHRRIMRIRAD